MHLKFKIAQYDFDIGLYGKCETLSRISAEANETKTCVINDPLSQTHSPTSSDHYFRRHFFCDILKSGDVRTDGNMCENYDHLRPGLGVGRVDHHIVLCFNSYY